MGTHAHRLTSLRPAKLPRRFVVFSSQPIVSCETGRGVQIVHTLRLGALRALRRDGTHSWSQWDAVYDTAGGLLDLVAKYTTRREVTWIVVSHLAYQWVISGLGIAGCAGKLDVEGYNFSGRVQTARIRVNGKVVHLVDVENYLDKSLAWIAAALGAQIPVPPADTDTDSAALDKARLEVAALSDFVQALVSMSGNEMDGAWGWSLGSLAWRSYRCGLMDAPIYVHADPEATALERAAYLGGRSECRFIGSVRRPIYVADYNSLYAHCMASEPMPAKLLGVHTETVESLRRGLQDGLLCVAQVTVNAKHFDYPYLIWPGRSGPPNRENPLPAYSAPATQWRRVWGRGSFNCTLATPDLRRSLEAGEIVAVGRTAWYEPGHPFGRFVDRWYARRLACREKGKAVEEAITKRVLTVLPGKFGQHARDWIEVPGLACQQMTGHWWTWSEEEGQWKVYRALRGCAQVYGRPGEWKHSCPAISAHVTSAARVATDNAVSIAGDFDCYYYDTDALHVTGLGLDRLRAAELVHETELGRLKVKGTHDGACYRNARDYTLGNGGSGAAGSRGMAGAEDSRQPATSGGGLVSNLFDHGSDAWRSCVAVTALSRHRYAGRVNPLGWVQPLWMKPNRSGELPFKE